MGPLFRAAAEFPHVEIEFRVQGIEQTGFPRTGRTNQDGGLLLHQLAKPVQVPRFDGGRVQDRVTDVLVIGQVVSCTDWIVYEVHLVEADQLFRKIKLFRGGEGVIKERRGEFWFFERLQADHQVHVCRDDLLLVGRAGRRSTDFVGPIMNAFDGAFLLA